MKLFKKLQFNASYLTILLALGSFLISLFALLSSKESNKIANDALQVSQKNLLKLNRPYVTIRPRKIGNEQCFYELSVLTTTSIKIKMDFELKNIGNVAAINLKSFEKAGSSVERHLTPINLITPSFPIMLGPGEVYYNFMEIVMDYDNPLVVDSIINAHKTDKGIGWTIHYGVTYSNEIDSTLLYMSEITDQIFKNEIIAINEKDIR